MKNPARSALWLLPALVLAACSPSRAPATQMASAAGAKAPAAVSAAAAPAPSGTPSLSPDAWPRIVVHKDPSCGCCGAWVDHLRGAGFTVEVREEANLNPLKERLGVPYGKGSCHTAEVDGYVVEGHVPADDIKRLLIERPDAKGLVLPGMPVGSPGMEVPGVAARPYTVEQINRDGSTVAYAAHEH